jgi:hypothetical protein
MQGSKSRKKSTTPTKQRNLQLISFEKQKSTQNVALSPLLDKSRNKTPTTNRGFSEKLVGEVNSYCVLLEKLVVDSKLSTSKQASKSSVYSKDNFSTLTKLDNKVCHNSLNNISYKFTEILDSKFLQKECFEKAMLNIRGVFEGKSSFIFTQGPDNSIRRSIFQGMKEAPGLLPKTVSFLMDLMS